MPYLCRMPRGYGQGSGGWVPGAAGAYVTGDRAVITAGRPVRGWSSRPPTTTPTSRPENL